MSRWPVAGPSDYILSHHFRCLILCSFLTQAQSQLSAPSTLTRASLPKRTVRVRRTWRNVRLVSPEPGPNSIINCAIGLDPVLFRGAVYVRAISRSTEVQPTSCQSCRSYRSLRLNDRGTSLGNRSSSSANSPDHPACHSLFCG